MSVGFRLKPGTVVRSRNSAGDVVLQDVVDLTAEPYGRDGNTAVEPPEEFQRLYRRRYVEVPGEPLGHPVGIDAKQAGVRYEVLEIAWSLLQERGVNPLGLDGSGNGVPTIQETLDLVHSRAIDRGDGEGGFGPGTDTCYTWLRELPRRHASQGASPYPLTRRQEAAIAQQAQHAAGGALGTTRNPHLVHEPTVKSRKTWGLSETKGGGKIFFRNDPGNPELPGLPAHRNGVMLAKFDPETAVRAFERAAEVDLSFDEEDVQAPEGPTPEPEPEPEPEPGKVVKLIAYRFDKAMTIEVPKDAQRVTFKGSLLMGGPVKAKTRSPLFKLGLGPEPRKGSNERRFNAGSPVVNAAGGLAFEWADETKPVGSGRLPVGVSIPLQFSWVSGQGSGVKMGSRVRASDLITQTAAEGAVVVFGVDPVDDPEADYVPLPPGSSLDGELQFFRSGSSGPVDPPADPLPAAALLDMARELFAKAVELQSLAQTILNLAERSR